MFRGEKIYLRPIKRSDLLMLNNWKNDETTYKYLGGGFNPISIDEQEGWIDQLIKITDTNKRFIICNNDDLAVGMIGLYNIHLVNRTAEIGIFLGQSEAKKKGYASEAVNLIERYAINYLNLRKINLNAVDSNENAVKLWNNNNYKVVGRLSSERYIDGEYFDVLILEKFLKKL